MARDTEFFAYAGSSALSKDSSGAAWPVYKDFEVEHTDNDVFIYAPSRPRLSKVKQVYGLSEEIPNQNPGQYYAPLRDVKDLFLRFARLAYERVSLEVMHEWATTYGVLGIDSLFYWDAPRPDYPRTRRESLRSFKEAVREAAWGLELYQAAMVLDGAAAEAILERHKAGGSKGYEGTLKEKQEWAAIVVHDNIVGPRVEADCYPCLLRTVENERAHFWYDKRTKGFAQGWGFRSLLGAMHLQMMLYMTGGGEWKPCKRLGCYGRVAFNSGELPGERRTPSHKEFCSKACRVWWSENYGENNKKAKAKRRRAVE